MPTKEELRDLHKLTSSNREALSKSKKAGCFYCLKIYDADSIEEWTMSSHRGPVDCAICPKCGVDSVLPDSECNLNPTLLSQMSTMWF
jgi:hypothetical protein